MQKSFYKDFPMDADGRLRDFFQVILTDEYDVLDQSKLRSVYKNLLQLNYDNKRTQNMQNVEADTAVVQKVHLH
ncbi:MAG: exonuclease SbcCD subunit D C-terminal domain-containing protein [Phascolarctobacterium sp.]